MDTHKAKLDYLLNSMDLIIDEIKGVLLSSKLAHGHKYELSSILMSIKKYQQCKDPLEDSKSYEKKIAGVVKILSDTEKLTHGIADGIYVGEYMDTPLFDHFYDITQKVEKLALLQKPPSGQF